MLSSNRRPTISAIVPTRNRPALLREALASVRSQQGSGEDFDLELVVVDDGSTVDLREVVDEFAPASLLRFEEKRGPAAARNLGLAHSRGEYVAFLDDDDVWLSHKLKTQLPHLEADRTVGMIYGQVLVTKDGASEAVWPDASMARSGWIFSDLLIASTVNTLAVLVRRDAFQAVGNFDEALPPFEDDDMWLRVARQYRCLFLPGVVAHYRRSSTGLSRQAMLNGEDETKRWQVLERALNSLPEGPDSDDIRRRARAAMSVRTAQIMWQVGEFAKAAMYLTAALREMPGSVRDKDVRNLVRSVARSLAEHSATPWVAVKRFGGDIDRSLGVLADLRRVGSDMQSEVWFQAAKAWTRRRRYGLAVVAAGLSLARRPSRVLRRRKSG
jgi:cellulose synthase/poly-beta-1,6-N-acetylglucosamine synthase-like glycosyltransferase